MIAYKLLLLIPDGMSELSSSLTPEGMSEINSSLRDLTKAEGLSLKAEFYIRKLRDDVGWQNSSLLALTQFFV